MLKILTKPDWWHKPVTPDNWRLRQEDLKFEASLGCSVRSEQKEKGDCAQQHNTRHHQKQDLRCSIFGHTVKEDLTAV